MPARRSSGGYSQVARADDRIGASKLTLSAGLPKIAFAKVESLRKRRYRELLKNGGAVLHLKIADLDALTDCLVALGRLDETEIEDRGRIAAAIVQIMAELAAQTPPD